ncbi:aldehyde dehydrogenase family protein [Mesorhizobium sp. M8A.F.Ca.ET.208.01.1.1]|uniref:aldehyde dehydrogenase family protein n=1 Tax=unclassified Mesorhizobium TaxID=325217 RepID=UPI0010933B83|nr:MULTISPECIES: aldehyde dehydrogenase family protein [unclassified Mesorhizobium]TGQ89141.1 aldehyde dehydrogenase family protein [Mesorhizobium sp. M8A.F.Ca.ET.208.01.1.1]TGR32245.1 aldehyde dehydrogenase family protein [Mesorhizobium sp. M8A.F.Ca.ET.202.01.1.1]TGT50461.1 aldehyde dehydrogenase family protein [Mesorhizobium sp. M8A.F.Ca.ET.167.01.1.1]TGU40124.1 aldehyde dehydrogenase family protein [bacterium M00.F.Ca.ET.156.01.1.1]
MKRYTLFIGGKPVETARHADILNPSTGEVVGAMPLATVGDLDAAVTAAAAAFEKWQLKSSLELADACRAIAAKIEENSEELARLLTLEQGKPLNGLGSRFEIGGAVAWTRHTAEIELPVEVLQDTPEGRVELHRKPIGVVGSITPWNWPVMIACWHIIPAIRAGNTVVIKPSPQTPLSTIRLVELMNEVLPAGVVNVVTGENEIGAAMSAHPGIAKLTFTGSTSTGKKVMANAVDTLKRLTLELGGNDAGIVLPDADPKEIAEGLFWGAFINNGQTCACLKRLYVHDSLYDAVCESLVAYAAHIPVGDGLSEQSILGPVQNRMQLDIVASYVEDARAKGGRVLIGGQSNGGTGYFYPITIVADVDHGCELVDREQFGPALPIIRYTDLADVIAKANDNPAGLGGSVWGRDTAKAKQVAGQLECGTVWINKHGAIQPNAPFGGVKQSGIGVEFGVDGLKEFTTIQTIFC